MALDNPPANLAETDPDLFMLLRLEAMSRWEQMSAAVKASGASTADQVQLVPDPFLQGR